MRAVVILRTGLLALAAVAGCSSSAGQAAPSRSASPPLTPSPDRQASAASCLAADLRWRPGGGVLPFRFADGGGVYVTRSTPVLVTLKPGASAYLVIAKYRCDLGIVSDAVSVRLSLRLPGGTTVSRRLRLPVPGAPGLSYCTGGRHDPGQLVVISPLEPSLGATRPAG